MGWQIIIGEGASAVTINANMKFNLQTRVTDDDSGAVNYIETFIEVEGDVVASTASGVTASIVSLENLAHTATTSRVRIQLNGTSKWDYLVNESMTSPRVIFFKTVDEEGNADSHWRYALSIYVKEGGGQGGTDQPNITEQNYSVQTITENDRVVRKIWKVSCKGNTLSKAYAHALSFKPNGKNIHGEIERFFEDNRAVGGWIWDLRRTDTIIDYAEEPVQYSRGNVDYISSPQTGDRNPVLHELSTDATMAIVRGKVLGYTKALSAPPAHWRESKDNVRCRAQEQQGFVYLYDSAKGIWALPYMEVWMFTGATPIAPDHSGHIDLASATPPGD